MSKSSYFQDFLLKDQFPVPVTLRTIATTRPPRPRYPPPCLSARVIVPVRIVSPVSLCLHCSLLVLSLCVLWLASPVYNPADLVSHDHQSISLRVVLELHSSDRLARTTDSYIALAPIPSTFPRYHRTVPNCLASALVPHFLNLVRLRLPLGTTSL